MKAEERHELKRNELKEILRKFEPYWRRILGVCVVLLAVISATTLVSTWKKTGRESAWSEFFEATANGDFQDFQELAENQSGNAVALWARQAATQAKLIEGSLAMSTDRAAAMRSLQEAVLGFNKLLEQAENYEVIRQRSLWGLAQTHENLNELSTAKESYKRIVETWPGFTIAERAQARIDSLNDPATQDFYAWYFAQTPPAARLPATGEGPGLPFGQVPTEPDVSIPNIGDSDNPGPSVIDLQLPFSNEEESGDGQGEAQSDTDTDAATSDSVDSVRNQEQ